MNDRRTSVVAQAGMSLVELMVATVISLIGVLVIFQVFAVNEGIRRSTTSGSDEQISGLIALTLLERELRTAGFAINDPSIMGCTMQSYDSQRTPTDVPPYPLVPVDIQANAGTIPDLVRVVYGQPTRTTVATQLQTDMSSPTDPFTVKLRFGFNVGDLLVVGQPGANCTLAEVTGMPGPLDLGHDVGTLVAPDGSRTVRFNKPGGTPVVYRVNQAKVVNLGPLPLQGQWPVRNEYSVLNDSVIPADNNKLRVANLWAQTASPIPVAEQIVQLKAEYGIDDGASNGTVPARPFAPDDDIIDKFTAVSPTTQQGWWRVKVVRLAVVSRSANPVEPTGGKGTACDATPAFDPSLTSKVYPVRWARGPDAPLGRPIDVRSSADWQCYKYKVYETTVPLRNVLWRQPS